MKPGEATRAVGRVAGPGDCYPAAEAVYHAAGGKRAGLTPAQVDHEGQSHWFVRGPGGRVYDPTADQFETPVPYDEGVGRGFLTRKASRRGRAMAREAGLRVNGDAALRQAERAFEESPRSMEAGYVLVKTQVRSGLYTLERALDNLFYRLGPGWGASLRFVNDVAVRFPREMYTRPVEWHGDYLVVDDQSDEGLLKLWNPKTSTFVSVSPFGPIFNAQDVPEGSIQIWVYGDVVASQANSMLALEAAGWGARPDKEPVFDRAELMTAAGRTEIPPPKWSNWLASHAGEAMDAWDRYGDLEHGAARPRAPEWTELVFPAGTQTLQAYAFRQQVNAQRHSIADAPNSVMLTALQILDRRVPGYYNTQRSSSPLP